MNIGGNYLERMPRAPYLCKDGHAIQALRGDEQERYKAWEKEKREIVKKNSSKVFSDTFLRDYERRMESLGLDYGPRDTPIKILCREFGLNLRGRLGQDRAIKTLQIGCGPAKYGYRAGSGLDKALSKVGADTMNLDIRDVQDYYPEGRFTQGSWLDIEELFGEGVFDAIFMDKMDPSIDDAIMDSHKPRSASIAYQNLILKTMSRIQFEGMFFISGINSVCFSIPEHVNDVIGDSFVGHSRISPGLQVYKRG